MAHVKYKGKGRQSFTLIIDMNKFAEYLSERINKSMNENAELIDPEMSDWEYNIDYLKLIGTYDFKYTGEYFSPTRESPEEDSIDRPYIWGGQEDDEKGYNEVCECLLQYVPAEIKNLIKISMIKEEEEFDEI